MRKCACVFVAVFVFCPAGMLHAIPAWPVDANWVPVSMSGGSSAYMDIVALPGNPNGDYYSTPPTDSRDIVGGTDHSGGGPFPSAYWYHDGANLLFRLRVDDDATGDQFVWTALLNTDADSVVDFAIQLDLSSDNQVEVVAGLSGGPGNGWDYALADAPHAGAGTPATDYYRFVSATAYDGSDFSGPGHDDYFVDFGIPTSVMFGVTGTGAGDPFSVAFATSSTHTSGNKDLPDYSTWSDPIVVPEPASASLLGLGLLLLACRRLTVRH